jgi:hypothetical protein
VELESYYNGVAGWGVRGKEVTPGIQPGQFFRVRFTPPRAGMFMYNTHLHEEEPLAGGLYGPLIKDLAGRCHIKRVHFAPASRCPTRRTTHHAQATQIAS